MQASQSLKTFALVASEMRRRARHTLQSGPLQSWRYSSGTPGRIVLVPRETRPARPELAADFYNGRYDLAGEVVDTDGESPFVVSHPSQRWADSLHSFRWLRHLDMRGSDLAKAHAAALIDDWIRVRGDQFSGIGWKPEVTAQRIIAWLTHGPSFLAATDNKQNTAFRRSIARQTRFVQQSAGSMKDGYPRLHAQIAATFSALCLPTREKNLKQACRDLDRELDRQVLPDGGHISRNPKLLLDILSDLIPLCELFRESGANPPKSLFAAIDRMIASLEFFRHSNGDLAQFNGTGAVTAGLLKDILPAQLRNSPPQQSAPNSGYQRLAANKTVVFIDTGSAVDRRFAENALAGCLSFELSSGKNLFIMNCGIPDAVFEAYTPFARATAAHSTATIADTSSARFAENSRLRDWLPSDLLSDPQTVTCERRQFDGFVEVNASHDGYAARFNLVHRRVLQLSDDGNTLNGADRFEALGPTTIVGDGHPVSLRFHIPPEISASLLTSGHSIMLAAPNRDAWTFTCVDGTLSLEESIRFSGPGEPRKCEQIVVTGHSARNPEIRWVLSHKKRSTPARSRKKQDAEPDLLAALSET